MSYFDRPERRAEWEKELAKLRAEKQARMNGEPVREYRGASTERAVEKTTEKGKPFREQISYVQLLREESMANATVTKTVSDKELQKEVSLER